MNKKRQGDIGVAHAIAYYAGNGWTVCYPLTDAARYDLVVDKGNCLVRVQIKTTGFKVKSGSYQVGLVTNGGNRSGKGKSKYITSSECDIVFVLTLNGTMYELPATICANRGNITLGRDYDNYIVGDAAKFRGLHQPVKLKS